MHVPNMTRQTLIWISSWAIDTQIHTNSPDTLNRALYTQKRAPYVLSQELPLYTEKSPLYTLTTALHTHTHTIRVIHQLRRATGWRRPIGYLNLQLIFRKRTTNYRALLRKMTCRLHRTKWPSNCATLVSQPLCWGCAIFSRRQNHMIFANSYFSVLLRRAKRPNNGAALGPKPRYPYLGWANFVTK